MSIPSYFSYSIGSSFLTLPGLSLLAFPSC
jgi:hypothetical protein